MTAKLRIALVAEEGNDTDYLKLRLQSQGYQVVSLVDLEGVLGVIYSDPPDIVIFDLSIKDFNIQEIVEELKRDSYFSMIPVIGLIEGNKDHLLVWDRCPLDELVIKPIQFGELFTRITLSVHRIQRIFDHNPLTKLPGNTSIQRSIEESLGKSMSVCYLDINHFKPYNDNYGFSRGDEVIRMIARIMSNSVRESCKGGFVGHIGGDDYVFIVPERLAEKISQMSIDNFNLILKNLFGDEENRKGFYLAKDRKGFYLAKDRKGNKEKIPLLGIAIAIVPTSNPKFTHCGRVVEVAAELKKFAKRDPGSRYVVDRRKD